MKIWFISDTHTRHQQLQIPSVDVVIHAGDEAKEHDPALNAAEARAFFDWYQGLPIPHKLFVPGNHSVALERGLIKPADYPGICFLIHEATKIEGWKVFGSPYTPRFFDWAYMKARQKLEPVWASVPEDVDILVTHGPPKGVLDLTIDRDSKGLVQVGCNALRRHVDQRIRPRIHAFGHLHDEIGISNYGQYTRGGTQFINAACCNLRLELIHPGFVVDMKITPE